MNGPGMKPSMEKEDLEMKKVPVEVISKKKIGSRISELMTALRNGSNGAIRDTFTLHSRIGGDVERFREKGLMSSLSNINLCSPRKDQADQSDARDGDTLSVPSNGVKDVGKQQDT